MFVVGLRHTESGVKDFLPFLLLEVWWGFLKCNSQRKLYKLNSACVWEYIFVTAIMMQYKKSLHFCHWEKTKM